MSWYVDDFEGNKLNSRWVATRLSQGGQNDGVWSRIVKDSKVQWVGVNRGTETTHWGEIIRLPLNATGDVIAEAQIRQKIVVGASYGNFGLAFNHDTTATGALKYGANLNKEATAFNRKVGWNLYTPTPFPGFPSQTRQILGTDNITLIKLARRNGYMFIYMDNLYVGQFAYAATITTLDIVVMWYNAWFLDEKSCDYVKVWPREVVLGGP